MFMGGQQVKNQAFCVIFQPCNGIGVRVGKHAEKIAHPVAGVL